MRRNLFDHLNPEEALAARILLVLEVRCGFNRQVTKREIERRMNANKQQPLWAQAWWRLIRYKYIRVSAGPNRQQFIELLEIPDRLRPQVAIKKPRRRRKRTKSFKEHLPEFLRRDGLDELGDAVEAMGWMDEDAPLQYVPAGSLKLS